MIRHIFSQILLSLVLFVTGAGYSLNANEISVLVNGKTFWPGNSMDVQMTVDPSQLTASTADIYLAVQFPDGSVFITQQDLALGIQQIRQYEQLSFQVPWDLPTGLYHWYFVLNQPGTDVFNPANWFAYDTATFTLNYLNEDNFWALGPFADVNQFYDENGFSYQQLPQIYTEGNSEMTQAQVYQTLPASKRYRNTVRQTADMIGNRHAQTLAAEYGLNIVNVTWEDTGRYSNSAVGPNISDMTIQVAEMEPRSGTRHLVAMPVIRFPNFSDLTADISPEQFYLLVGNESGKALESVTLQHFLGNLRQYLSNPDSWLGQANSLLAERDSHVLVSAQACFLPIPEQEKAEFNPVLFNYQSVQGDPAVLTILATREGTSVTIVDNVRDAWSWGQRLFFNTNGEKAVLTGQRLSDFKAETANSLNQNDDNTDSSVKVTEQEGLNLVLLIQVPLKQKERPLFFEEVANANMDFLLMAPMEGESNVEDAVIGHGPVEGPFIEIDNLAIERDPDFPIRVTVQFYKATSNGVVSAEDMAAIAQQIQRVYDDADYVGSLVVDGPSERPTEYTGDHNEPPDWWANFWERHKANTGQTWPEVLQIFYDLNLYAGARVPQTPEEMEQALQDAGMQ